MKDLPVSLLAALPQVQHIGQVQQMEVQVEQDETAQENIEGMVGQSKQHCVFSQQRSAKQCPSSFSTNTSSTVILGVFSCHLRWSNGLELAGLLMNHFPTHIGN